MIQNADDAGAKVVQFYVDRRQHGTSGLVKPELAAYQGPALILASSLSRTGRGFRAFNRASRLMTLSK
jgi:hypothetical protein